MDFTAEQGLLRDSVRRACERHAGMDVVRKLENDPIGIATGLWSQLAEMGLTGLLLPEDVGGSAMTLLDAAVVYEEFGRALAPSPHFVSCVLAAGAIARVGSPQQQAGWLPRIAGGESIVTIGWLEPGSGFGERGVRAELRRSGDAWSLTGVKQHVPFARAADALLVLARCPGGVALVVVDPSAGGVELEQQLTVAGDTQYKATFTDVPVGPDAVLTSDGWSGWHDTMLDGAILQAAQAVGGARRALELTVDYAKTRHQFDKPLGAFQSISHYLADASTAVDGAQTLVWEAAWARSEGRPVDRLAPMAKLFAGQTFRDVTATAIQVFGGLGFTVEADPQLYFRRAKSLQLNWWDDRHLEELIATDVLG